MITPRIAMTGTTWSSVTALTDNFTLALFLSSMKARSSELRCTSGLTGTNSETTVEMFWDVS